MDLLQNAMWNSGDIQVKTLIEVQGEMPVTEQVKKTIWTILAVILVVAAVAAVGWAIGAFAAAAGYALGAMFVVGTAVIAVVSGVCTARKFAAEWFPINIYLPVYKVTAQEIFSNQLPLFDVNFFEAKSKSDMENISSEDMGIIYDSGVFRQEYKNEERKFCYN